MGRLLLLRPFLSGTILFVGLAILIAFACSAGRWSRLPVLLGLTLVVLSAVPAAPAMYVALVAATVAWFLWAGAAAPRGPLTKAALAVVATTMAAAEWPASLGRTITLAAPRTIIVLGDSLSAGDQAWPATFAASSGCAVDNRAAPGARLSAGARQIGSSAAPCDVLIALGGNDILGEAGPDRFAADLESLLRAVTTTGCHGTMLELPLFPFQNTYGRAQRRLAAQYGITLVPRRVLTAALTRQGHTIDGLHLSAAGHSWLGRELSAWIRCTPA